MKLRSAELEPVQPHNRSPLLFWYTALIFGSSTFVIAWMVASPLVLGFAYLTQEMISAFTLAWVTMVICSLGPASWILWEYMPLPVAIPRWSIQNGLIAGMVAACAFPIVFLWSVS